MKISQEVRTQLESATKGTRSQPNQQMDFSNIVQTKANQLKEQEFERLMKDITKQGDKLSRTRSFQDLAKYKQFVQRFMKEAAQYGLGLNKSHSWNRNGKNRMLTTIKTIDQKLIELTNTVLEQEKKGIGILQLIGEIKGLLVNLYT
ncbi:YaaR family protein [Aquibacillus sp. 3ASR75-11]|uniref:YaaR family protein n=1 Tax=Terrihalobacillus insolitus TaxID=2950438 RepID=A0A9X4AN21_9BACI|nr:YaaR family protein [Terrihalobacillus insolitus]MDC3414888.1 YaaR family protein [Terrihalobacillus insolitus]MDC3426037.1 YaaR family protein [Terrihalobacillus insolitus]